MKLGLINSAWAQSGRETSYGIRMTKEIGFDTIDIFADPLDAISTRFGQVRGGQASRFSKSERQALSVLGLGEDSDLHGLRQRYSGLVRRYHPDKNGGDRSHEARLRAVIEAYQLLRKSAAFA